MTPPHGRPLDSREPDATHAARLGAEIRARRQAQGLTLQALAALIGFSPQHLSEVELAKTTVSAPFVTACDQALDARGTLEALLREVVCERALQRHDRATARHRSATEGRIAQKGQHATWRASGDNLGTSRGHIDPPSALIREARETRGWSIVAAARALIESSPQPLPDVDSVVRSWKRWERATTPSRFYRPLLANLLGIDPAALAGRNPRKRGTSVTERSVADLVAAPQLLANMTLALTVPPADDRARVAGRRVGMADVGIITADIDHLRRLDNRYGSGRVRERVAQLLHHGASTVMHGSYSEQTGKALFSAVAQASWLAGLMAADVGRQSLTQRYYLQAVNLAMCAGDRLYAASVLSHASRLTVQIGQGAVTEHDRLRYGRAAIAQARAGHSVANGTATPVLSALLHAVEARGHALLGDASATRTSVLGAQRHYERARLGDEPSWLGFYTEAELAADLGRCLRDVGEPERATRLLTRAIDGYEPWRVRNRGFAQTDLAAAHLVGRDFEHAAALGHEAVRTAARVSSARALDRLRVLQRQVRPLRSGSSQLGELDDRISDLLARNRSQRQNPAPR